MTYLDTIFMRIVNLFICWRIFVFCLKIREHIYLKYLHNIYISKSRFLFLEESSRLSSWKILIAHILTRQYRNIVLICIKYFDFIYCPFFYVYRKTNKLSNVSSTELIESRKCKVTAKTFSYTLFTDFRRSKLRNFL